MALSKDYCEFEEVVLTYVKTGKFPETYPDLISFTRHIINDRTAGDWYNAKLACEEELKKNTSSLEGVLKYAFSGYKAQADQNNLFKQRLESIIPGEIEHLKALYRQETLNQIHNDEITARLKLQIN